MDQQIEHKPDDNNDAKQIEHSIDIPREEIPLPSKGKIYPENYPLANKKTILIRAMSTLDEDILSSDPLIKEGKVVDEFIKAALGGSINIDVMLPGDKNAVLFAFRATGYGTDYEIEEIECPKIGCGKAFPHIFDLSRLEINTLDVEPLRPNENIFAVPGVLPHSKAIIEISLLTLAMEREVEKLVAALATKNPKIKVRRERSLTLYQQIQRVDDWYKGKHDKQIREFVEKMLARDSLYIRKYIKKITPELVMKQQVTCPICNKESSVNLPMDLKFFFPED